LQRRGFNKEQIGALRMAFRTLFASEGVFARRLEAVRTRHGADPLVAEVLAFIDAPSRRGLIRSEAAG
jgi:UDP-N-acetylglucosamine acyltransferase